MQIPPTHRLAVLISLTLFSCGPKPSDSEGLTSVETNAAINMECTAEFCVPDMIEILQTAVSEKPLLFAYRDNSSQGENILVIRTLNPSNTCPAVEKLILDAAGLPEDKGRKELSPETATLLAKPDPLVSGCDYVASVKGRRVVGTLIEYTLESLGLPFLFKPSSSPAPTPTATPAPTSTPTPTATPTPTPTPTMTPTPDPTPAANSGPSTCQESLIFTSPTGNHGFKVSDVGTSKMISDCKFNITSGSDSNNDGFLDTYNYEIERNGRKYKDSINGLGSSSNLRVVKLCKYNNVQKDHPLCGWNIFNCQTNGDTGFVQCKDSVAGISSSCDCPKRLNP